MDYTTNYHLPQWVESDRIMMEDFNAMCAAIENGITAAKAAADAAQKSADTALELAPRVAQLEQSLGMVKLAGPVTVPGKNQTVSMDLAEIDMAHYDALLVLCRLPAHSGGDFIFSINGNETIRVGTSYWTDGSAVIWILPTCGGITVAPTSYRANNTGVASALEEAYATTAIQWDDINSIGLSGYTEAGMQMKLYGIRV